MEAITFDALTVAMVNDALKTRGMGIAQIARAIAEVAASGRQHRHPGIDVRIRSRNGPIQPGEADMVATRFGIHLSDSGGTRALRLVGTLRSRSGRHQFEVTELGIGDRARFVAAHRDVLRLQVTQQLPETLRMGLASLVGHPLSRLVGHAALERPEAAGILIRSIDDPTPASRSRVGMARGMPGHGFDVRVDAPPTSIDVTRGRRSMDDATLAGG